MNIVSLVANLVKERDYYEKSLKECQAVIKQLTEGPGEFEYIHPLDLMEIMNRADAAEVIDVWGGGEDRLYELTITGKKYKQSLFIPAKSKFPN